MDMLKVFTSLSMSYKRTDSQQYMEASEKAIYHPIWNEGLARVIRTWCNGNEGSVSSGGSTSSSSSGTVISMGQTSPRSRSRSLVYSYKCTVPLDKVIILLLITKDYSVSPNTIMIQDHDSISRAWYYMDYMEKDIKDPYSSAVREMIAGRSSSGYVEHHGISSGQCHYGYSHLYLSPWLDMETDTPSFIGTIYRGNSSEEGSLHCLRLSRLVHLLGLHEK